MTSTAMKSIGRADVTTASPCHQGEALVEVVTSRPVPMSAAERKRRERARKAMADGLVYETPDWREFTTLATLPRKAGCRPDRIVYTVLKELVDNALDADPDGQVAITKPAGLVAVWDVTDAGPGIDPDRVPEFFSVKRPMLSSKRRRLPSRGALGNGTRVVMGAVAAFGGGIEIETRRQRLALRIDRETGERWWHLVGSAVEHGAACLVKAQQDLPAELRKACSIDFGEIFRDVEGEDEEAASLAEVLEMLQSVWPQDYFPASRVAEMINSPMEGERDKATKLREFFEDGRPGKGDISVIKVGKRLGAITDVPVTADGKTLKLVRSAPKNQAAQWHIASYFVRAL